MVGQVDGAAVAVGRRAVLVGVVCVALLAAVYLLAVWTVAGQRFEDAVLRAASRTAGTVDAQRAVDTLALIRTSSVVAASVLVLLVALLRRKLVLGVAGVAVVAASIAAAETMQRVVLRPVLLDTGYRREDQSFPSGHAAVAISLMCALVLVTPYRLRGPAVLVSSLWAASVEVAAVQASWHRPSDTIGSDLLVVVFVCVAVGLLARWGRVREAAPRTPLGRLTQALVAGSFAGVAVLACGVAGVLMEAVRQDPERYGSGATVLMAGRALALAGSAAVAVTLLGLLRRVDLGAAPGGPGDEGSPHAGPRPVGVDRAPGP